VVGAAERAATEKGGLELLSSMEVKEDRRGDQLCAPFRGAGAGEQLDRGDNRQTDGEDGAKGRAAKALDSETHRRLGQSQPP